MRFGLLAVLIACLSIIQANVSEALPNHGMREIERLYPRWFGLYQEAASSGDYLYTVSPLSAQAVQIHEIDLSNAARPVEIITFDLVGITDYQQIRVEEDVLCVTHGRGLVLFSKEENGRWNRAGDYPWEAGFTALELREGYAFVGCRNNQMMILDISDPLHPSRIGVTDLPDTPVEIRLKEDWAYLMGRELMIADIWELHQPDIAAFYDFTGLDMEINGNTLLLAQDTAGVGIYDIANPENVVEIGRTEHDARQVEIVNGFLFSSFEYGEWWDEEWGGTSWCDFFTYNLQDPTHPVQIATIRYDRVGILNLFLGIGENIAVSPGYGGEDQHELHIYSVNNEGIPGRAGSVEMLQQNTCWDLSVKGDYLYSIQSFADTSRLKIVDISVPSQAHEIRSITLGREVGAMGTSGNMMVFYDANINALKYANTLDSQSPQISRFVTQLPRNAHVYGINITDGNAYIPRYGNGTGISIVHPGFNFSPEEVFLPIEGYLTHDVVVVGDYGYFPSGTDGFYVLDLHNPAEPSVIRQVEVRGWANAGASDGRYLYISDGNLNIFSLEDPEHPDLVAEYDAPDSVAQIKMVGNYAFLITGLIDEYWDTQGTALCILDISDPASPFATGYYRASQTPARMAVRFPHIFVQMNGRLSIFDCSEALTVTKQGPANIPHAIILNPAFPNPFNQSTQFSFTLPSDGAILLDVFDIGGHKLETLIPNQRMSSGEHLLRWNASGYPAGRYFARMQVSGQSTAIPLNLVK